MKKTLVLAVTTALILSACSSFEKTEENIATNNTSIKIGKYTYNNYSYKEYQVKTKKFISDHSNNIVIKFPNANLCLMYQKHYDAECIGGINVRKSARIYSYDEIEVQKKYRINHETKEIIKHASLFSCLVYQEKVGLKCVNSFKLPKNYEIKKA